MAVKGPRVHQMTVQPVRPLRRVLLVLALLLMLAGAVFAAWQAGRYSILTSLAGGGEEVQDARSRLEALIEENRQFREEMTIHRVGGDLARQVEEQIRTENRTLQSRIAELEEAVGYYRRVVMPDKSGKGLRLERFEILPAGRPGVWSFQMVLVRTGETDAYVEGRIEGVLEATGPGGKVLLPLAELLDAEYQAFRVRYVEDAKVEFRLPDGLRPERLELAVVVTAPHAARIDRIWSRRAPSPSP